MSAYAQTQVPLTAAKKSLAVTANTYVKQQAYKPVGKALGICAGSIMILLAVLGLTTNLQVSDIVAWVAKYFTTSFSVVFASLVMLAGIAIVNIKRSQQKALWFEVGTQCANGVSTLALTYTLLGISLGIGALSQQSLSPDNVNNVISILTAQFSMAFMTTVVGLPTAAIIRAWISILYVQQNNTAASLASDNMKVVKNTEDLQ